MRLSSKSIIILLLSLLPFVYFYPAVLGDVTLLPGDGWLQNLGVRIFIGAELRRGAVALWNPYIFAGMPLLASVYPGALYPPNWLFAVFAPKLAMNLVVITTFHLALAGTYLFARKSGSNRLGALLAGVAFSFGGFMINHIGQTSRIAAAAWLPWVLLALAGCSEAVTLESTRRGWTWVALGALFIALQFFAGEPQMLIFTALVCGFYCVFALAQFSDWRQRGYFLAACAALVTVGVLFAQMQLRPSLELLAQSERNDPGALFFAGYSYPPWQLPALLFPYFFGGAFFGPYHTAYWGRDIAGILCGYVGLLPWLLACVAVVTRRDWRVWLWVTLASVAVVLSFGGYLPFGLHELLYRVPGYKTFRGLYRHQYELTFALAMLAALGATRLGELESRARRSAVRLAIGGIGALVLFVAALFRFFPHKLASQPLPANAASLANPEALVPLACFALSALALWVYAANQSAIRNPQSAILLALLLGDLAAYGHFFDWRTGRFAVAERLADPPAVRAIKAREANLNSFRLAHLLLLPYDYTANWPVDDNVDRVNSPNTSMARGLQSVAGYDILRPVRIGELTGTANSALAGFLQESGSFTLADRGFDLLNVKYLLVGHGGPTWKDAGKPTGTDFDGVHFAQSPWNLEFKPGMTLTTDGQGAAATELAVVSTLTNSAQVPDGAPVVNLKLHARDGRVIERALQAGRDSSEWAYDRADVRANIKHQRARLFASTPADGFAAHQYVTRLPFERAEIARIEWSYARADASIVLLLASLHDAATGRSTPVPAYYLPPERWRKLGQFEQVELYENTRLLPRAWFVREARALPKAQVLAAIRTSQLPDDAPFDPAHTALFDAEDFAGREVLLPPVAETTEARAEVTSYEPQRITLTTRNAQAGLLVLSEMYDHGWQAAVDGAPVPVWRVDYNLRGLAVPAGEHRVEFVYRAPAFRNGLSYAALGVLLLLVGGVFCWRRSSHTTLGQLLPRRNEGHEGDEEGF